MCSQVIELSGKNTHTSTHTQKEILHFRQKKIELRRIDWNIRKTDGKIRNKNIGKTK